MDGLCATYSGVSHGSWSQLGTGFGAHIPEVPWRVELCTHPFPTTVQLIQGWWPP
jgi:hypothetical protein